MDFVNFDLVPDLNWDAEYLAYLPKMRQTKSTLEYYKALQELCAKLHDGHTGVYFPAELTDEALARPLVRTRLIEDKVLIVGVYDDALRQNGVEVGAEVKEIDSLPVKQYAEKFVAPYQSASTKQDLEARTYEYWLLAGAAGKQIKLTLSDKNGKTFVATLPRLGSQERSKVSQLQTPPFELKMLPGNIAYVALNTFNNNKSAEGFEAAFGDIAKADALIIDVRNNGGGNSSVGYRVLKLLTDKPFKDSSWYVRNYRAFARVGGNQEIFNGAPNEIMPDGARLYARPVILLTSPRTYSAAEDFTVAFSAMKRGLIIGEPTGGSTGQPLSFKLPGGGSARVCTKRDRFPDGREFVGKGIQPDEAIITTVADVRAGRDPVLEAALRNLRR
jgi:carboxyl-terminal processing protease